MQVEVAPHHTVALEWLALLDRGERDKARIASAVSRFLDAAPHVSALGDALWPAEEEPSDDAELCWRDRLREPGNVVTQLQNAPIGWAAFREFRQEPTPIVRRLHGNRKHGRYSKSSIADMRMLRLCIRIVARRLRQVPGSIFDRPIPPPGWAAYLAARQAKW
jgi:hypothetical protein